MLDLNDIIKNLFKKIGPSFVFCCNLFFLQQEEVSYESKFILSHIPTRFFFLLNQTGKRNSRVQNLGRVRRGERREMSHCISSARPFVLNGTKKVQTHLGGNRSWILRRGRRRRPWKCCLHRNLVGHKKRTKRYANLAAELAEGDRGQELRTPFVVDTAQPPGDKLLVKNNCLSHKVSMCKWPVRQVCLGSNESQIPDADDTKLRVGLFIGAIEGPEGTAELHQRWISSLVWCNAAKQNSDTRRKQEAIENLMMASCLQIPGLCNLTISLHTKYHNYHSGRSSQFITILSFFSPLSYRTYFFTWQLL